MGKLIIRHGDIRTEHELGEIPVVIGRDPECHLFFADRKLSRRHACIEPDATGFRILDLGSRNGSWVNEERIDRRALVSGDEIRVGDVLISFVHEDETDRAGDEPTVYLGSPGSDETATVVLGAGESSEEPRLPGDPSDPDDSSTRILATEEEARPSDDSSTQLLPSDYESRSGGSSSEDSSTQLLSGQGTAFGFVEDSSTRALPLDAFEENEETLQRPEGRPPVARSAPLPGALAPERPESGTVVFRDEKDGARERAPTGGDEHFSSESLSNVSWRARTPAAGGWTPRFAVAISLLVLFTTVVLVVPLYSTSRRALNEESQARGRALMELLAALNGAPLGEGRPEDASVGMVEQAPGVSGAFVLDTTGKIVAPASREGEVLSIDGLDVPPQSVRSIRSGQTRAGESFVAGPINYRPPLPTARETRVGVAVVIQRSAQGAAGYALALGLALVLIALAATVVLIGRMTLPPIEELRRDIESVGRGEGRYVDETRPFQELSDLARAVNRLVDSAARRLSSRGNPPR
ncbi:MAG TPA: FHA domain-containing protein [Vicinamibacteria bacterium]|nr:FHA domain-containing protein [Vicinamibacteria bacterium]